MRLICRFSGIILIQISLVLSLTGCQGNDKAGKGEKMRIIFLHHSTGELIWKGGVPKWFKKYNSENGKKYKISEQIFPKTSPYGWKNYPFDYWNIWVKNAGEKPFMSEPTLEMLTKKYDVIIFKHCFPASDIKEDTGKPDISSEEKRIENYKLQYIALKEKLHQFPEKKFIVWTGAALVKNATDEERARRAKEFFDWVRNEWDQPGDNIYLWDFYELETEGGLYLKDEYAESPKNSHPNAELVQIAAPFFCQRIVEVIEGRGDSTSIAGK